MTGGAVGLRHTFREQYTWVLLPVIFAICFIVPNRTGATNLYRLFVVLPMLLCFRPADFREIWANSSARWLLILCAWMTLALWWDGWSGKDAKLFWRELNLLALFYAVFLISKYQQHRWPLIVDTFLVFGVVGALLIVNDWEGLQHYQAKWHHRASARGVFGHHLEVGWIMAVLGLIALRQWLHAPSAMRASWYLLALLFFTGMTFLVQARGGYVVFIAGTLLLLLLTPGKRANWLVVSGAVGLLLLCVLFQQELLTILNKIYDRGTSKRMPIWDNGWEAITGSVTGLFFGHGVSATAENQLGNFTAAHYHNFFLNHAFYTGLVGLVLYFGLLASLLRKAFSYRNLWLWGVIMLAMQVGFIPDGDRLWVNPSAMMLCVLLPMAIITFGKGANAVIRSDWKTLLQFKNYAVFLVVAVALGISFLWLLNTTSS